MNICNHVLKLFIFSAMAGMFSACATPDKPAGLIKPAYFNLEQVLDNQVKLLTEKNAGAEKINITNGREQEKKTVQPINWQRELEMFRQASINRPAWRAEFIADSTTQGNGIKTITYRRKPESSAPVEYLVVDISDNKYLNSLTAKLSSDNMLFTTNKVMEMKFSTSGPHLLQWYSIKGTEKMLLTKEMNYRLSGEVVL